MNLRGNPSLLSLNSKVQFSLDSTNQNCTFKHLKLIRRQQNFLVNCINLMSIFLLTIAEYGRDTDDAGICKDLQEKNYTERSVRATLKHINIIWKA